MATPKRYPTSYQMRERLRGYKSFSRRRMRIPLPQKPGRIILAKKTYNRPRFKRETKREVEEEMRNLKPKTLEDER